MLKKGCLHACQRKFSRHPRDILWQYLINSCHAFKGLLSSRAYPSMHLTHVTYIFRINSQIRYLMAWVVETDPVLSGGGFIFYGICDWSNLYDGICDS